MIGRVVCVVTKPVTKRKLFRFTCVVVIYLSSSGMARAQDTRVKDKEAFIELMGRHDLLLRPVSGGMYTKRSLRR